MTRTMVRQITCQLFSKALALHEEKLCSIMDESELIGTIYKTHQNQTEKMLIGTI